MEQQQSNSTGRSGVQKLTKLIFVAALGWSGVILLVFIVSPLLKYSHRVLVPLVAPKNVTWEDKWKSVADQVSIYSAFVDDRINGSIVRIVGIAPRRYSKFDKFVCVRRESQLEKDLETSHEIIPEHHSKKYSAIFFFCQLEKGDKPEWVGLRFKRNPSVWIRVHGTMKQPQSKPTKGLSVCVRPLYGDDNITLRAAEFITAWQFLGASRFVFYDYKMSSTTKRFLKAVAKKNQANVVVLPWNLKVPGDSCWCNGQLAFLQDCLYRTMADYEFVAPVDLDEYMIPIQNVTLLDVLKGERTEHVGSYVIYHALFCLSENVTKNLVTQTVLHRHKSLGGFRSKSVHRARLIDTLGIHHSWKRIGKAQIVDISAGKVLLHHYRSALRLFNYNECTIFDNRALRMSSLMRNSAVLATYRQTTTSKKRSSRFGA